MCQLLCQQTFRHLASDLIFYYDLETPLGPDFIFYYDLETPLALDFIFSYCTPPASEGGRTKCQPDEMPTGQNANLGWHFVRDFFSVVGILSRPTFWLAFCPGHLNMFWHFVRIMKNVVI